MFRGIPKQELDSIALDDTQGDLVVSFRGPQQELTNQTSQGKSRVWKKWSWIDWKKEKFLAAGEAYTAVFWHTPRPKGELLKAWQSQQKP